MNAEVPPELRETVDALTERLLTLDRVVGVFWGRARSKGELTDEPALVVHVTEKRPLARIRKGSRIPRELEGIRVDVVDVGGPLRGHGWADPLKSPSPSGLGRPTTVTATAPGLALVSGHGALPLRANGHIRRELPAGEHGVRWRHRRGRLTGGRISRRVDFAVAAFDGATLPSEHPNGAPPVAPHRWQTLAALPLHTPVTITSRRGRTHGQVECAVGRVGPLVLRRGDRQEYFAAVVLPTTASPFSSGGDSGALVTTTDGVAVGTIVGGSRSGAVSYVLPLFPLIDELGGLAGRFFRGG